LVWDWQYNSISYSNTTYLDVVTPYVDIQEAAQEMGFGSDANDPNHKTHQELKLAERYARNIIEGHTGQKFYLHDDRFFTIGSDSDTLSMPKKINRLHTLYANDELLIDNINSVNNLGIVVENTVSGFGIRANHFSGVNDDVYIANGMVPPSINDSSPKMYFAKDRVWRDRYVKKISTTDWDFEYSSEAFSGTGSSYADKLLADYVITQMVLV
jgi:hypothetical protein